MDDDVALGEQLQPVVVEAEAVGAHIAGHRRHPGGDLFGEPVAVLLAEQIEAVVLQDLLGGPLHRRGAATGPDEEHHPAVGDTAEETLDQRRSEEAGGPGDEESLAGQALADEGHRICLPYGK